MSKPDSSPPQREHDTDIANCNTDWQLALAGSDGICAWNWDLDNDRFSIEGGFLPPGDDGAVPIAAFLESIHPGDRARVEAGLRAAAATGDALNCDYRARSPGGDQQWVQMRGRVLRDRATGRQRFPGVLLNITERKRLELNLAERERRYHALFTATDQGYCLCEMIWDDDGRPADYRFLELNPKFVEATGLSRELAFSGTARQIVPGLEDFWVERYGNVVKNGVPDRFESRSEVMGRWFDVFAQPVGDSRFALVFSDVSARKQDEQERERLHQQIGEERRRLHQVFEQAPVAIVVLRGPDYVVEFANPLYEQILEGRQLAGRRFADIMPELGQEVWDVFRRVLHDGETFVARNWLVPYDRDGDGVREDHWFNLVYSPLREADGAISSFVAIVTEVTEEVKARNELVRVNRELEEFAYVASHDLQEPLRMVNIYTQLLVNRFSDGDATASQYADFVRKGVARMESLIRDLLSYSRIIQSEREPAGPADLNVALRESLAVLQNRIDEAGATITAGALPVVLGDTLQLGHVFQNLISNSLKYRRADTPLRVQISAVEQPDDQWKISVADNGIGFEPEYAERIFGLFKRLHTTEYPGTGIGLSICQRLLDRYGGRIWAEGEPGKGATFHFVLPRA
ncbi:MAG: PAS domain-containing protein [Acidobacteria bacterium]|nr:PAS domain-containing protein [Acidobacteriota bacterium]